MTIDQHALLVLLPMLPPAVGILIGLGIMAKRKWVS